MLIISKYSSKEHNNLHCDGIKSEMCVKKAYVFSSMATYPVCSLVLLQLCAVIPEEKKMLKAHHY